MLPIRKRIKKTSHQYYSLRRKINSLKKISNDKKIYAGVEEAKQKNDCIIPLFPSKV